MLGASLESSLLTGIAQFLLCKERPLVLGASKCSEKFFGCVPSKHSTKNRLFHQVSFSALHPPLCGTFSSKYELIPPLAPCLELLAQATVSKLTKIVLRRHRLYSGVLVFLGQYRTACRSGHSANCVWSSCWLWVFFCVTASMRRICIWVQPLLSRSALVSIC